MMTNLAGERRTNTATHVESMRKIQEKIHGMDSEKKLQVQSHLKMQSDWLDLIGELCQET